MGNRYYYYLIAGTMTANIVGFVPRILIESRNDGMAYGILIGSLFGMALIYAYTTLMDQFPGKSYAEIMDMYTPKWFNRGYIFITACVWFTSGVVFLLGFTFIAKRFINPETPITLILLLFLMPLIFGCVMDTKRVLYATEIILVLIFPLLLIIFFRVYTSHDLSWITMKIPLTYLESMPAYFTIAAAGYTYDGVMNLAQFNKVFTKKRNIKSGIYIAIASIGIINLVTSAFIPIGINGIEGVASLNYPWVLTSDSMRIEFGFFERILFLFLLLFMGVAILVILHHWHVAFRFFTFVLHFPRLKYKGTELVPIIILTSFIVISFTAVQKIDEHFLYIIEKWWFVLVQPVVVLHTVVLFFVYRRAKKCRNV